jgi:hypothetical protein
MIKLFSSNIYLGFEKTLNLAQQSLVTSLISRGVTCDADNLSDYQSDTTSTHTNCLIQLLKSGGLRFFRLNRGAHSTAVLMYAVKRLFSEVFKDFLIHFNHLRLDQLSLLVSGRRILQRYNAAVNTSFSTSLLAVDQRSTQLLADLSENLRNSLNTQGVFRFRLRRKWGEL